MVANARVDFERPFGEEQFLTVGTALDTVDQDSAKACVETSHRPRAHSQTTTTLLEGRSANVGGVRHLSVQVTGDWTWQPGVRGRKLSARSDLSGGLETDTSGSRTGFPASTSAGIAVLNRLSWIVSYTSRIQAPRLPCSSILRCAFSTPTAPIAGNPDLRTGDDRRVRGQPHLPALTAKASASPFTIASPTTCSRRSLKSSRTARSSPPRSTPAPASNAACKPSCAGPLVTTGAIHSRQTCSTASSTCSNGDDASQQRSEVRV